MAVQATCATCGALFTPRRGGKPQTRCSARCRRKAANAGYIERNAPERAAQCAECGGPVEQAGLGRPRRFCSDQCKAKAGNRDARIRKSDPERPICSEENCPNVVHAGGLCSKHYRHARATRKELFCARTHCTKLVFADGLCRSHYDKRRRLDDQADLRNRRACAVEGCERPWVSGDYCALHYQRVRLTGEPGPADPLRAAAGQGYITEAGYRVITVNGRGVLEHRVIMERMLGRPLQPFESPHHKNGIRHDNRPENLELWTKPQPAGQRAEDLVEWVVKFYPDLVAAEMRARRREARSGQLRLAE
jgi:endogenous inhibitor of DNA gyrase (YacG/DUF329 family)